MFTLMKSIRGEIKSYIRRCDNCKQLESAGCCRCISAHLFKKMTTSSLQSQSSHHGLQSRLCTRISYNLTVHTDKYRRAFLFFFPRLAKCFGLFFFRSFRVTVASRRPSSSLAATLVHDHVLVMSEEHLPALIVQHAQRAHFGRGAAGRRHSVGVVMFQ